MCKSYSYTKVTEIPTRSIWVDKLPYDECIKKQMQWFVDTILSYNILCTKIVLFGSYARADYTIESDFDILILTREEVSREKRGLLCSVFEENNADLVFYTEKQFESSNCLLVRCVRNEGVLLWKS